MGRSLLDYYIILTTDGGTKYNSGETGDCWYTNKKDAQKAVENLIVGGQEEELHIAKVVSFHFPRLVMVTEEHK